MIRTFRRQAGFTTIELLIVIGIIVLLMAMAVPGLVGALRKGKVNEAANVIERVSTQARQLARSRMQHLNFFYGVVLVNDEVPAYAALTYGDIPSKANILKRTSDNVTPVCKLNLNRNITFMLDTTPLATTVGWMYQNRSGYPIGSGPYAIGAVLANVNIGAPNAVVVPATNPDLSKILSVQTIDGRYRSAVAIYQIGLSNIQEY